VHLEKEEIVKPVNEFKNPKPEVSKQIQSKDDN
jgi:hypothetical protein